MIETASETIERLQGEVSRAQQTIEAQQLAYRAMVADYQHCANTLQEVSTRLEEEKKGALNGWLRAIDEELVCTFLGIANPEESYEQAKVKLNRLIAWHVNVACDPAVNGGWVLMPQVLDDRMQAVLERNGYQALVESARKGDQLGSLMDGVGPQAANEIERLRDLLKSERDEALEQARLLGMGSEREAALMAKLDIATASNGRLRWLLGQIMDALPANRDWLDPQLEREAVIARAQERSA